MKTTGTNILALCALLAIFTLSACKKKSINCGIDCDYSESIVFNFGFENVTIQQDGNNAHINGIDSGFSSFNNWDEWDDNEFGNLAINYEEGSINQRHAEIIVDPTDPNNHVLEFSISEPHINEGSNNAKARVQLDFGQTKCLREIHERCRLYLPSNSIQTLEQYDELVHWFSLFEYWNNANWTNEKYPFRITVGLHKENGAGNPLFFQVKGDKDKNIGGFEDIWKEQATGFTLPYDTWMDIEIYILEGDENNGRFYMSVQPEGSQKTVLFDFYNYTHHPKEKCPDGFTHMQPLKLYTSDKVAEYFKNNGNTLRVLWDDLELLKNADPF